ncbi:hypothetical protein BBJ28_00013302 [Nothophytophthora sp. Chile5]|nr:hypothetical protein BBJ28_00013302 [Nothophytophthora sp. Chile5]
MKTHTGEQPHQCPVADCGKRFSTSGNLARHRKLHSLRKVSCPAAHCTRVFTSREKLVPHLKVHLARSPHTCDIEGCGKTFSTAGNLTRHRRTQHRVMPSTRPESLVRSRQELPGRVVSSGGGPMPLSDLLWPTPPPVETTPSSRILEQDVQDLFECLFVESAAAASVRGSSSSNASMRERVKIEQPRESKGFLTATYEF